MLRDRLIGGAVVYALFVAVLMWGRVPLFKGGDHVVWPSANVQVAEAEAWLDGSLSLPERRWDTAVRDGRVYSHFPPLMTLVSAAVMSLGPEGVPFYVLSVLFVVPIPLLAYVLFLRRCESVFAATVLACAFVLGSSALLVMCRVLQSGKVWQTNHAISQLGLLIFLIDYFGKRRVWLGGIGAVICTWSRYTMAAYLLPLWWVACARDGERVYGRRLAWAGVMTVAALGLPMTLNTLKFASPLNSGYKLIYEGRWNDQNDRPAQDAKKGIFSPVFVPRNLYAMNLGFPQWKPRRDGRRLEPNTEGTGIWWTTPLLLYLLVDWRRIWARREHRALLVAAGVIYVTLMFFHTTGAAQRGYNRFSLDFLLVLLVVAVPWAFAGKRRYVSTALAVWGVAYFLWVGP